MKPDSLEHVPRFLAWSVLWVEVLGRRDLLNHREFSSPMKLQVEEIIGYVVSHT